MLGGPPPSGPPPHRRLSQHHLSAPQLASHPCRASSAPCTSSQTILLQYFLPEHPYALCKPVVPKDIWHPFMNDAICCLAKNMPHRLAKQLVQNKLVGQQWGGLPDFVLRLLCGEQPGQLRDDLRLEGRSLPEGSTDRPLCMMPG